MSPSQGGKCARNSGRFIDLVGAGWWAGRVAGPVAFVGREGELSRLLGALGGGCPAGAGGGGCGGGQDPVCRGGDGPGRGRRGWWWCGGNACRWRGRCRCCRWRRRWVSWPGWTAGGCWRRRWRRRRGMCGGRWGGCCRSWGPVADRAGLAGVRGGGGSGCFRRWRSCWARWPAGLRPGGAGGRGCALGGQRDAGFPDLPGPGRRPGRGDGGGDLPQR